MSEKNSAGGRGEENFLVQGSILAAAGICVRFIGLLYRIPMTRILGDAGNGYYSTAYEIYNIGLILSSYSLPLAVSKLIAAKNSQERFEDVRRIFRCALLFGLAAGGAMTLFLFFGADALTSFLFKSPNSALPLKVMAPTILVFSVMGVIRGYFQGNGNMVPTSISQIIEQIVNACVSVGASWLLMRLYADRDNAGSYGAAGGTLGTLSGAAASLLFLTALLFLYRRHRAEAFSRPQRQAADTWGLTFKLLILTIVPIILSQFVYQLSGTADNALFGRIMDAKGLAEKERASLLGIYSSRYRLLSNVPVAVASALGTSMIPSVVRSRTRGESALVQEKIRLTIKFNMLIAIPCAFGLGVLAAPILRLLFGDSRVLSARLMQIGAPAVLFFSLSTVTTSVLQGIDLMRKSVTHSAAALALHAALVYIMLAHLGLGVYGLVIGNVTFALTVCALNWRTIGKTLGYRQEVRTTFLLPVFCSAVMSAAALAVYTFLDGLTGNYRLALLAAIPSAAAVYGLLLILTRTMTAEELPQMPMGGRILALCRKLRLM